MTQQSLPTLVFPEQFQGFFRRTQAQYEPSLYDARAALANLNYPVIAEAFYAYVVRDNPQPSFMLLPLMYLGMAEASGAITHAHHDYLPIVLLTMEICAVMDDTADRTPRRSGRPTFAAAYGEYSATPLTATLVATALEQTIARAPALLPLLTQLVVELGARELWEIHNRYPSPDQFDQWLANRYAQVTPAVVFALDSALHLNQHAPLPQTVAIALARIFQDVDDIVNVVEAREHAGENDDFKLGMVTRPLVAALQADPTLQTDVLDLWTAYATSQQTTDDIFAQQLARVSETYAPQVSRIHVALRSIGVPATLRQIEHDAQECVAAAPPHLRPLIHEFVLTFADRVRRLAPT